MLAVGALVPLSQGRLGKSWKHASALKELARSTHHSDGPCSDRETNRKKGVWSRTRPRPSRWKTSGRPINPGMTTSRQNPNMPPRCLSTESIENRKRPTARLIHAIAPYRPPLHLHLPGSRCLLTIPRCRSRLFSIPLARSSFPSTRPRYCGNGFF